MFDGLRYKAKQTARSVALGSAGGLLILAGLGLWAGAGYIVLAPLLGVASALAVVGGVVIGLGLIAIGVSRNLTDTPETQEAAHQRQHSAHAPNAINPTLGPTAAVVAAFLNGLSQGAAQRRAP